MHPDSILQDLNARPLRQLSQNFLTSAHWADKLTQAVLSIEADEIWEIGPGLGALTEYLIKNPNQLLRLFEFDKKLSAHLEKKHPTLPIEKGDVLEADFKSLAGTKKIAVLSNLPYHLSSPILFKFIEEKITLQGLVLTFQKEFADRLTASPRTPDYGALSVVFQWHFTSQKLGNIPPGAFYPPPKVDSTALLLKPTGTEVLAQQRAIVRTAFQYRRKTLANNFKGLVPKEALESALSRIQHRLSDRPEELSSIEYYKLSCDLYQWFKSPAEDGKTAVHS